MKRKLITTIILSMLFVLRADAFSNIIMDYQGETVVRPHSIERNLLINSDDGGEFDIAVRPLDDCLRSADGEVKIPLDNIYINNTREDVYMRYNEYSTLFRRLVMGGVPQTIIAKVRDYGMVPAGVYLLNFEIQAVDSDTQDIAGTSVFTLQFNVPIVQEINFRGERPIINVTAKDAFIKNKSVTNVTNPILYINSNCDWELTLKTDKFGEGAGNYYVRTIASSPAVTERLQERVLLEPNKEIIVARGKAPSNNEYITMEYSVEGKDGNIMKAGNYHNNVRYVLRSDRGK